MTVSQYRDIFNQSVGKRDALLSSKKELVASSAKYEKRALAIEQAQIIIQQVSQQTQTQLKFFIEDIVKSCMDAVFPDMYDFELVYEIKRGKTEANLKFTKDGKEIDIMNASGGGLIDVASLGLRMAAWSLSTSDNVLILDEGLKFLSRDLQPRAAEILKELSAKLDLQIIMVSHAPELLAVADKLFTVTQKDGVSKVEV